MLIGLSPIEKAKLKLTKARDYYYLTRGNCLTCDGFDEEETFAVIRGAMKVLMHFIPKVSISQFNHTVKHPSKNHPLMTT